MTWFIIAVIVACLVMPVIIELNRKDMTSAERADAPGEFADLSRGATHYQWFGPARGHLLICIHGLTTPSFVWNRLVRGLAVMGFRVLTYDLYGRGFSDKPRGRQSKEFFIDQLDELLEHEGLEHMPVSVLGYSMGGSIAAAFAARHSSRITRLMLIAPAGIARLSDLPRAKLIKRPIIGDWLMLAVYPGTLRKGIRAEADAEIGPQQERELDYKGFVPAVLSSLRGILSRPLKEEHKVIRSFGMPVLAIWGEKDDVIPLTTREKLERWNGSAVNAVVPGAGHGLTYTHSEDVLAHIRGFVAENPDPDDAK